MTQHDFKPGDRIINHIAVANLATGTVIGPRPDTKMGLAILWDGQNSPSLWTDASVDQFLGRQPIEAGCWVRVLPVPHVNPDWIGKTFQIEKVTETVASFTKEDGTVSYWSLENIARIADPEPAMSSADGLFTVHANEGGISFRVSGHAAIGGETTAEFEPDETVIVYVVGQEFWFDPTKQTLDPISDNYRTARDLAVAIHSKHFASTAPEWKVADDLPGVLLQIDNMTAGMMTSLESMNEQCQRLGEFIMHNIPGEPSRSEGAVDCAIRIMGEYRDMLRARNSQITELETANQFLTDGVKLMGRAIRSERPWNPDDAAAWVKTYDPQPAPTFKRGDLITWGYRGGKYRIVGDPNVEFPELMAEDGSAFRSDVHRDKFQYAK